MIATLPTRRLGNTDLHLTRSALVRGRQEAVDGPSAGGPQDDAESIASIRHAIERRINWIDTAAVYGLGHSEEVVQAGVGRHSVRQPSVRFHEMWTRLG